MPLDRSKEQPSKPTPADQVSVDNLANIAPRLRAEDWRSPLVRRLLGDVDYEDSHSIITDFFRGKDLLEFRQSVLLRWQGLKEDFHKCIKSYQEPNITEFAALGLSCILVRYRADVEITEVTRRGERADYWLGDKELLLEVSGQSDGNLQTLRDSKAIQLLDNPFNKSGYVCVVNFSSREAYLWFYQHQRAKP
jgi:hypothetical protein